MLRGVVKKEIKKLYLYWIFLFITSLVAIGYLGFHVDFSFSTVEPESMMWYKFSYLEDKPYSMIFPIFLLAGLVISLGQFLPEKIDKRVKILLHLPITTEKIVFYHIGAGLGVLYTLLIFLSLGILFIMTKYYPDVIVDVVIKDLIFWIIGATILYLGVVSVVIENSLKYLIGKVFILSLSLFFLDKNQYQLQDLLWIVVGGWFYYLVIDSFKSLKNLRSKRILYLSSGLIGVFIIFNGYSFYKENFNKDFSKYYIFYSPVLKKFVYQKNYGDHHFEYGIKGERTFNRKEYESSLPFVYWKNLDIVNKLPINIDGKTFDKKTIKESRLSFSYNPSMLRKKEADLYPLFNPSSKKGVILFPEEIFTPKDDRFEFYDFDSGFTNKKYNLSINKLLKERGFTHPGKGVWGKTTNLKPYDWGYLLKDIKDEFFSLEVDDNIPKVKKLSIDKDLIFARISENRQKILQGIGIDSQGKGYLIGYQDYLLIDLDLPEFNYKTMRLQLISNPMYYLIRYNDKKRYYAVVFDKEFNKLAYEKYE
ncbi:MAG: DUF4857 domain-containing protein [Campylobacterales bacterium]|nr:DUF4857 domain-containing protein [Campylobacterales bacterium]